MTIPKCLYVIKMSFSSDNEDMFIIKKQLLFTCVDYTSTCHLYEKVTKCPSVYLSVCPSDCQLKQIKIKQWGSGEV